MTRKALILSLQTAITEELINSHKIEFLIKTGKQKVSLSEFLNFIQQNNDEAVYQYLQDFSMKKNAARFTRLGLFTLIQSIKILPFEELEDTEVTQVIDTAAATPVFPAELKAEIQQGIALRKRVSVSSANEEKIADAKTEEVNVETADTVSASQNFSEDLSADAKTTNFRLSDEAKAEEKSPLTIDLHAIKEQVDAESKPVSPRKQVRFAADVKEPKVQNLRQNSFFSVPECLIPGYTAKLVISSMSVLATASFIGLMCVAGPQLALILATTVFALIAAAGIYSLYQEYKDMPANTVLCK